jgi:hypothetical protein
MNKLKRRYSNVNRSKFCIKPTQIRIREIPILECDFCEETSFTKKTTHLGSPSRLRTVFLVKKCNGCGYTHYPQWDIILMASTKAKASQLRRGSRLGQLNLKRKKRRCHFTTEQWIRRCDRIDNGWKMGEIRTHFKR